MLSNQLRHTVCCVPYHSRSSDGKASQRKLVQRRYADCRSASQGWWRWWWGPSQAQVSCPSQQAPQLQPQQDAPQAQPWQKLQPQPSQICQQKCVPQAQPCPLCQQITSKVSRLAYAQHVCSITCSALSAPVASSVTVTLRFQACLHWLYSLYMCHYMLRLVCVVCPQAVSPHTRHV